VFAPAVFSASRGRCTVLPLALFALVVVESVGGAGAHVKMSVRRDHMRYLVVLAAVAIGLLMMLLVPGIASADPGPGAPVLDNAPAVADPPAAEEQVPGDPAAPPAAEEPPTTEPTDTGTTEPAPPPATEPETSTPAPAPTGDTQPIPGVPSGPAAAETPAPEATPDADTSFVLPGAPSVPGSLKPAAVPEKDTPVAAGLPPPPTITLVAAPSAAPDAPATTTDTPAPAVARAAPDLHLLAPTRPNLVKALGGVDRAGHALDAARDVGPGPAGQDETRADNPFDTIAAPGGPVPAGSSLLAVLASYVLPGSGLPTSALLLLVQLAVILAAFYGPRSGLSERIHALGRLGPEPGYRTVLARPG
jgi:hypothetical protein